MIRLTDGNPIRQAMPRRLFYLLLALLLLATGGARAQTEEPIPATPTPLPVFALQPGSTVEGNIADAQPGVRYRFTGRAGDAVTIRMATTSGDLDPFLTLFGPEGELIDQDDDGGGGRNALIALSLPRAGEYVIEASRYSQGGARSAGTFRLTLEIAGLSVIGGSDPLAVVPDFRVQPPPTLISYREPAASAVDDSNDVRYFAFGGQQGDLVRVIMAATSGDLSPRLDILNAGLLSIASSESQSRPTESIAYATLPETGWYLIRAGRRSGSGSFDLYADRLIAGAVLAYDEQVTGEFNPAAPTISYVFNARMGDLVAANLFALDESSGVQPELRLLNLGFQAIATGSGTRFATVRTAIPRSGTYILQATNLRPERSGGYSLRLTGLPVDVAKLDVTPISYNEQRRGFIEDDEPIRYFRFAGKAGERVTIQMSTTSGTLDPYLILASADLGEELTFNDNVSATRNARIVRYRLDKDGDYLILATRAGLAAGNTTGGFDLALTVGDIALATGALSATLTWNAPVDLNLFIRDPNGHIVSWANPQVPGGGSLQIDSNTHCDTPTDQPVEHIFWPQGALPPGDYEVWAWYQAACAPTGAVPFTLQLTVNGRELLQTTSLTPALEPGQRFGARFRAGADGNAVLLDDGQVISPSPQQAVSEGGDPLLVYGDSVEASIDDETYAYFYQFQGRQGERVAVSVERLTGDLDPVVVLRDGDDNPLPDGVNDDASPETRDARLAYTLPSDGRFVIAVTRFGVRDGTTSGTYRLTLERVD